MKVKIGKGKFNEYELPFEYVSGYNGDGGTVTDANGREFCYPESWSGEDAIGNTIATALNEFFEKRGDDERRRIK